jgi:hypothetical protein
MGIRKDLLVTEEIAESSDLRATPFEFERSDCLATPLALASSWKSKGAVLLEKLHCRKEPNKFFGNSSIRCLPS